MVDDGPDLTNRKTVEHRECGRAYAGAAWDLLKLRVVSWDCGVLACSTVELHQRVEFDRRSMAGPTNQNQ
jgi:hypothetical protein